MFHNSKHLLRITIVTLVCAAGSSQAQENATPTISKNKPNTTLRQGLTEVPTENAKKLLTIKKTEEIDRLKKQLETLRAQIDHLQQQQKDLRQQILETCNLSPENVVPSMLNMEKEILALRIDLILKDRIKDAMASQIAEDVQNTRKTLDDDQVLKNLAELVEIKNTAYSAMKKLHASGNIPENSLLQAQTDLGEAKIRLALRKEELLKNGGNTGIDKLNQLVRENTIGLVQSRVRLDVLVNQYELLSRSLHFVERYNEIAEQSLSRVNKAIDRVMDQLEQMGEVPNM
jgi:hypothetical protein